MNVKHALSVLFSISVLISCNKEIVKIPNGIDLEGADELGLMNLAYNSENSEQTITFVADGSWEIDIPDNCSWLTAHPSSGTTNGKETVEVVLKAEKNLDYKDRETVVYLLCNGVEQRDYLNVKQDMAFFREVKFSHTNARVTASSADYKLSVSVTNLEDWTPSASQSWVTVRKNSLNELALSLAENTTGQERTADITLTSKSGGSTYSSTLVLHQIPVKADADLLDLVFNDDATATDISASHRTVYTHPNPDHLKVEKDENLGYNVACLKHEWGLWGPSGTNNQGAYTVTDYDYQSNLKDGFTLETYVKPAQDAINKESKILSSTRGGGYALMHSGDMSKGFCFILNDPVNGGKGNWVWINSGVVAQKDVWYHLVATFDQKSGLCRIYVNGEMKGEVSAPGSEMKFSNLGKNSYMTVGGNSNTSESTAENPNLYAMFNGKIAIARVYDKALTKEQIHAAEINLLPGHIQLYD